MHEATTTTITVNGRQVELAADATTPLLVLLRNDLGLKGARPGCAIGECGSCTVLVDGRPTRSCITPLEAVTGTSVLTPEGLGTPDRPLSIQQAFIDEQAAQCGYCVNGIVMTVAGIADGPAEGREDALEAALAEHLCRCGTHVRIRRAARRALSGDGATGGAGAAPPDDGAPRMTADACADACASTPLPPQLAASPAVEDWLRVLGDGRIEAITGKAEIGQGLHTALAQIVAAQLDVAAGDVVVRRPETPVSPDERYTSGSLSVEQGGMALATAATALRRLLLTRAADRLGVPADQLRTADGAVVSSDGARLRFAELVAGAPVTGPIEASDRPHWHGRPLGVPLRRHDLPAKVTGAAAYVHDMVLDGMLHARAVLPPTYGARLQAIDVEDASSLPGIRTIVRDGSLVIVIAEREEQAMRAAGRLRRSARWSDPGDRIGRDIVATLRELEATPQATRVDDGVATGLAAADRRLTASYVRPYQAHGAMAPSCAVAVATDDAVTVHSHTQGVYPLRRELSTLLGMDQDRVVVRHADGPGCYGHNCADDAAALAAIAAIAVRPAPVRLQLTMEDELAWEPFGSAMLADLEAGLDRAGHITSWRHRARTDAHSSRPNGAGDRLIPAWLVSGGRPRSWPGPHDNGTRNSVPLYDLPAMECVTDFVRGPLRTSALRSLAAHHNVFAIESFMDELAEAAGSDPVTFRLAHLSDERARAVLDAACSAAGWETHVGPSGRGQGVAVCRYKGSKAYVAAVIDAAMHPETGRIRVDRVILACDAGVVVNPDGLRNQLEGGVVQGLSRALFERVSADERGVRSRDWSTYPVLRFADVPRVEVLLLDGRGHPPVGAGEAATPPVAPALANALDDAVGIRMRTLPLTAEQARQRLAEMSDDEMARVILA